MESTISEPVLPGHVGQEALLDLALLATSAPPALPFPTAVTDTCLLCPDLRREAAASWTLHLL